MAASQWCLGLHPDLAGHLVCDYEPKVYTKVYAPVLPLEPISGGFDFLRILTQCSDI